MLEANNISRFIRFPWPCLKNIPLPGVSLLGVMELTTLGMESPLATRRNLMFDPTSWLLCILKTKKAKYLSLLALESIFNHCYPTIKHNSIAKK